MMTGACLLSLPLGARAADVTFASVPDEMRWAGVPGASLATLDGGAIVAAPFGMRNVAARLPVTASTIFEAGSVSKPVFTYAVLGLVGAGKLDLRRPLDAYLPVPYPIDDPRAKEITAHHVMTHTSGLPNWRPGDVGPLSLGFSPGTRYLYSGEGYYFLQTVVEHITGMSTGEFMRRALDTLGMHRSSYVWRDEYAADCALPYGQNLRPLSPDSRLVGEQLIAMGDAVGRPFETWTTSQALAALPRLTPPLKAVPHNAMPNAAWSLFTTAGELAKFVQALVHEPNHPMLVPQLQMSTYVWRGLGIQLQRWGGRTAFFHTGSNPGFKTAIFGDISGDRGVVSMANSNGGFVFEMHVIDSALGEQPAVFYLEEP